jgi:beta-lactamase class A
MPHALRVCLVLIVFIVMVTACAPSAQQPDSQPTAPSSTPEPTLAPSPTAEPTIAATVQVAGVDVGGLTLAEAREKLERELALQPLEITAGEARSAITPEAIALTPATDTMLEQALEADAGDTIPLEVSYDAEQLRAALEQLSSQAAQPATLTVITDTETISRSFVIQPGRRIDIDAAVTEIDERLRDPDRAKRLTLPLTPDFETDERPTPAQLQEQIEAMASEWNGVVGVYVYDLASDEVVAALNQDTVFSGASVMKVPMLLQSYINIKTFDDEQKSDLKKMIVESDNLAANDMLAASVDGVGTEDALVGALAMNEMLSGLGLEHTYQYMPYEAGDYFRQQGIRTKIGPPQEGPAPHTDADPSVRTTPAEISRIFLLISQCSNGEGALLDTFENLSAERCRDMLDLLEQNGDRTRMVAGLPPGTRVAHKSGWIEDMQADVGIVSSPGGDFLVAVYLYRELDPRKTYLTDEVAAPVIAGFTRLVYSYYNPAGRV